MGNETILILANGAWEEPNRLTRLAADAGYVIATDGAWAKAKQYRISVDAVVGDLDSLTRAERKALLESATAVYRHPPDKDWTDLELAVDHALARSPTRIVVFGAFGGRLDHSVANVFLLEKGCAAGVSIELISGDETAWLVTDSHEIPSALIGDRVSLLSITQSARVETIGLRYALHGDRLHRASSHGVSNEVSSLPVRIRVAEGKILVVHARTEEEGG